MADKAISELIAANQVTPEDLFILEQSGTAKKLTGHTLENWLVSFADGHGGIQSIVKHSTSGLNDTYRITLADTTTFDFIVTNGKAISSIEQTSVSGLTRTYTIAFNDGSSKTFTVTDGRSITDIAKTETNALTDTYTISYNDGTSSTFTVKNGRGIQSFEKVSTVDLVDNYRITYNDGTSDEFTVTNGEKGDNGDNTYTHIKFASQEPTASSHSIGDIPDNWIGFYWGNAANAPTDWTQYKWFRIKGEKGNVGDPATLISSSVEYQVSDSGTIIPSGVWQTSVPVVAQGRYLWTRTSQNFNTGNPVISYSVSRMGLDGAGAVSSVANISPDANGNVPLTAENIGALSNTGGDLTGELRMNGQPISGLNDPTNDSQASNKRYVDAVKLVANNAQAIATGAQASTNTLAQRSLCNVKFANGYSTVLEACMNVPEAGGSFFAVVGSSLAAAEDSAWKNSEVQYLVLRDDVGGPRKTVLAIHYATTCHIKVRTLFSDSWLSDWISVDDSSVVLPISRGGTGATDKTMALYNLGLGCFGLANGIDLNTATVPGFYRIEGVHPNLPTNSYGSGKCKFGQMLVLHGDGDTIAQIAFDYINTTPYVRTGNPSAVGGSGSWTKWRPLLSQILDDSLYGDTLPPTGETGQIFFLRG